MKPLLIFVLLGYLSCQPRLDLTSEETYAASKQRVRASLSESQIERFDKTIERFETLETNKHWRVSNDIDQPEDRQTVLEAEAARMDELRRSHLHGMTANQLRGEPAQFARRLWRQQRNWQAELALESVPVARARLAPLQATDVALVGNRLQVNLDNGLDLDLVEVEIRVIDREHDFEMLFRHKFNPELVAGISTTVSTPLEVPPEVAVKAPELVAIVDRVLTSDGKALGLPDKTIRMLTDGVNENLEKHSFVTRLREPPSRGDG